MSCWRQRNRDIEGRSGFFPFPSFHEAQSNAIGEDDIDAVSVYLRSFFPQSWMWQVLDADASGKIRYLLNHTNNDAKIKTLCFV